MDGETSRTFRNMVRRRLSKGLLLVAVVLGCGGGGTGSADRPAHLVPAWRITCPSHHPAVPNVSCIRLNRTTPANRLLVKACWGDKVLFPQKDLPNAFVMLSLSTDLGIDVFFMQCLCRQRRPHDLCSDLHPSQLKFTCAYIGTGDGDDILDINQTASVSKVNMTASACCRSGGCSEDRQGGGGGGGEHQDQSQGPSRVGPGDDCPSTALIVGLAVMAVSLVGLLVLCLIVCIKYHRLQNLHRQTAGREEELENF